MTDMCEKTVDDVVSSKAFSCGDFLTQQNKPLAGVSDAREILLMYSRGLLGEDSRKKFTSTKVSRMETLFTRSGLKKLAECRIEVRLFIDKLARDTSRREAVQPIDPVYTVAEDPWEFIRTMQSWGAHGEDHAKYYLHMVFRFQMNAVHKTYVEGGWVIAKPSLQYIIDVLHPSTCSSKFPPEFKDFMHDCMGRGVKVVSLPVPKKDNGKEVVYRHNFEATPAVCTLRRKIQVMTSAWMRDRDMVRAIYPAYLRRGDAGNGAIYEAMRLATRARGETRSATYTDEKCSAILERVASVPDIMGVNATYQCSEFKTSGERLRERLGFFLRPCVRSRFIELKDADLIGDVFDLTRESFDQFRNFDLYCTKDAPLHFVDRENGEKDCRTLLMLLEKLLFIFDAHSKRGAAGPGDPSQIILDAIALLAK